MGEAVYEVHVVSEAGGLVDNSFGMAMATERLADVDLDTLLIGAGLSIDPPTPSLTEAVREAASNVRRVGSICVGAFILAEAGLLEGRRATTHWMYAADLQARFPGIIVEMDRIFITDGLIWTSAGMTAGIDLALGMIEKDFGREAAKATARTLVLHHRRAGGQSQHSAVLELNPTSDRVQRALAYALRHLGDELSVDVLAEVANLSPRQFTRIFRSETGQPPARAVERLRIEAARVLLEQGRLPIETIAVEVGFGDRERMRRAFARVVGATARDLRRAASPLAAI
jgi:transcriptional regulator GlxA family with amidase domain